MSSKNNIKITNVWHIGLITANIDQVTERFWNDLSIGPWQHVTFNFPEHTTSLYGKPVTGKVKAAWTQVGFLMFAFDQALTKPNAYEEILNKRGGGAHHLAFLVEDVEQVKQMQSLGYEEIVYALSSEGATAYIDAVENMGTVIELSKIFPSQIPEVEKVFPANNEVNCASNIKVHGAVHVAIAVRDVEKAARYYQEVLGIGPWKIITFESTAKYLGRETRYAVKTALAKVGTFVLVLEQPLSSPSPLQDFLNKNGQGIHHLCLAVDEVGPASEEMWRLGYGEILSVHDFGPNGDGESAYFDTESALGIVIELAKVPTGSPNWLADVPNGNVTVQVDLANATPRILAE